MIGLQAYTVRSLMTDSESCVRTLKKIKDIGYECVQLAGKIEDIEMAAEAADKVGLKVIGILGGISTCEGEFQRLVKVAKFCGAKDIGVSGIEKTEYGAIELAKKINHYAKALNDEGFTFSYHNHSHEFIRTECGKTVMEILIENLDEKLVDLMPDTYWLQHGGIDIRDFIEKLALRIKILHLKDMKRTADGVTFAEVGAGNINMTGIIELSRKLGIRDFIVEQDICDGDPITSAEKSYSYIKKILN